MMTLDNFWKIIGVIVVLVIIVIALQNLAHRGGVSDDDRCTQTQYMDGGC